MTTNDKDKIIVAARDAGFSDKQWSAMTYESGPYDITTPTITLERFWQIAFEAGRQAERESINQDDGTHGWTGVLQSHVG